MFRAKSNEQASKFCQEGSEMLKEGNFYEALKAINKSLCLAEPGSLEMCESFAVRSEIYFEMREYQKCLTNIEAAKEHGFEKDNKGLNDREMECKKLMDENKESDLWAFFKLSYPANEKLPFIIKSLEMKEDEKFGKHIITNEDLMAGDVIAIEESCLNFFSPKTLFTKCFNCLKSNLLDLIPSSASVMFCSKECFKFAYKKFNCRNELIRDSLSGNEIKQKMLRIMSESLAIAGSYNELQKLVESSKGKKTIFDFDLRGKTDKELKEIILVTLCSLMPKTDCGVEGYLTSTMSLPDGPRRNFFVSFITRLILIYMRNGTKLPGKGTNSPEGGLLLPFVALVNHSCDPNIYVTFVDNKCVFTVIRRIIAGEQIFVNYRKTFMEQPKQQRQEELLKSYEFSCDCRACDRNYPMPNKLPRFCKSFVLSSFGHFESNENLINELKENFKFMNENDDHHPCLETAATTLRIKELLRTLGERMTFP